jgi:hypothetical protein
MASNFVGGVFQAIGSTGLALPGALLYTYAAGGLTPLATYTDQGGLSSNANPVVCDAAGQASVWFGTSAYRCILKTAAGVTVWDKDNLSSPVSAVDLGSATTLSLGDALVGVKPTFTGAVATTQHQINEEEISIARFLSASQLADCIAGDVAVDCRSAVQAAVDYALHADRGGVTPIIKVPYLMLLSSPVMIDRATDVWKSELRFVGEGNLGGFYVKTAINMFSSNTAHTSAPVSEWVTFERVHFECSDRTLNANVINGDKFRRMKFNNCYFRALGAAQCTNFAQSWYFNMCQFRQWKDWVLSAKGMYDVHAHQCVFEEATTGKGFSEFDATFATGARGCSFVGNLFEGCAGPFLSLSSPQGIQISGNYGEGNTNLFVDLSQGTTAGVSYTGNYVQSLGANLADTNFYEVKIGTCEGFTGSGNYTDGRLYDFTSATAYATIGAGDRAGLALSRGTPSLTLAGNNGAGFNYSATTWTPTVGALVNCSSVVVTTATYTKKGREVSIQMVGTMTVTTGTTLTSFVVTLPVSQGNATDPATGIAQIQFTGIGFVVDTTGANAADVTVTFPANQVLTNGAGKAWSASLTYNAAS